MVLPKSSSVGDLDAEQLQAALGIDPELLLTADSSALSDGDDPDDNAEAVEPVGAPA